MLTAERLRELLVYDPATGVFRWLAGGAKHSAGDVAGCVKPDGKRFYRYIGIDYRVYVAHRLAWLYMTGAWPAGEIDHRDTDGTNNRWGNLRSATRSQNAANRGAQSNSFSGLKGAFRDRRGRWRSSIQYGGRRLHIGSFATPEEAHAAYLEKAKQLFNEFARAA